jgi:hypothetical protein
MLKKQFIDSLNYHPNIVITQAIKKQIKQEMLDYDFANISEICYAKLAKPADKGLKDYLPKFNK